MPDAHALFDRNMLRTRLLRAARFGAATFLLDRVANELGERLATVLRSFEVAADIGTPGSAVSRMLVQEKLARQVIAVHPLPHMLADFDGLKIAADEEAIPFSDASLDLAVSVLSLHFVNDLPRRVDPDQARTQA